MIISNSHSYICFHPPKAAGTSITRLLDKNLTWMDVIVGGTEIGEIFNNEWAKRFGIYKHATPNEIKRAIGIEIYKAYLKFCVVRDPISRFRSSLQFLLTHITKKSAWIAPYINELDLDKITSAQSLLDSKLMKSAFEKDVSESGDLQKLVLPQSIYFDKDEFLEGRYIFYKIEQSENMLNEFKKLNFISETDSLKQENISEIRYDENFSNFELNKISKIYESDFINFNYELNEKL